MRRHVTWTVIALLGLAGLAGAETIYLAGGSSVEGEILEMKDGTVVLTLAALPGSRVEIPFSRISGYGLYELKRVRMDRSSSSDHEELGDWAFSQGLFAFAMEEFGAAIKIAGDAATPQLTQKLADASSRCGTDKLARSQKMVGEGNLVEARRFLKDILANHPTCPAAKAAKEQVTKLDEQIRALRKRPEPVQRTSLRDIDEGLALTGDLMERGDRLRRLGLRESGHLGKAENDFEASIKAYERALATLERLAKMPGATERAEQTASRRSELQRRLVDVYVDLGHNYIVKGNLIRANHYMGVALAIDPNNPKALALRQAIAFATADDRWGRTR